MGPLLRWLLSALAAAACAGGGSGGRRIAGGAETTIERHNYLAALESDGVQFCGGSIVSATWVLSAAHCFTGDSSVGDKRVRVGSTASNQGGALHQVDRVEVSDVFNAQQYANDVALVHLATPVSFNDRVRAIRLTARGPEGQAVPGSHVTVAGWGTGKLGRDDVITFNLRVARIRILNQGLCKIAFSDAPIKFTETMICGAVHGRNIHPGDAGGPAVTDDRTQVGIVSWSGRDFDLSTEVFTDISHPDVHDFIQQIMESEDDELKIHLA